MNISFSANLWAPLVMAWVAWFDHDPVAIAAVAIIWFGYYMTALLGQYLYCNSKFAGQELDVSLRYVWREVKAARAEHLKTCNTCARR